MAVAGAITTALATCERQPDEGEGVDQNGNKTFAYILKGPHSDLETCLHGLAPGDVVVENNGAPAWIFSSANLSRRPGGLGVLTITCAEPTAETGEGSAREQVALDETWTLRSVRNDMSILAYCGESDAANASREDIEAWMKEPDGDLAKEDQYRKSDGTLITISNTLTLAVMGKIRKGVESVMRFYPLLTKTRTYSVPPAKVYENLNTIDTPSVGTTQTTKRLKKPGNLSSIIGGLEWLKCQDDCALMPDGKFQRVESWMGCESWDPDLYGEERWDMPLEELIDRTPHGGGAA